MIPLTIAKKELQILTERTRQVADAVLKEKGVKLEYLVGTMIEVPRAALTADQQQALAPLAAEWNKLGLQHKTKWLGIAKRYPAMQPEEQKRVQGRMQRWAKLTPEQRWQARWAAAPKRRRKRRPRANWFSRSHRTRRASGSSSGNCIFPRRVMSVAASSVSASPRCALSTLSFGTATVMPRPIAAGVFGMARTRRR